MSLAPYLVVRGAAEAIAFYKKAFGAVETVRLTEPGGRIGHAEMKIGDFALMLADEYPEYGIVGPRTLGGSAVGLSLHVPDADTVFDRAVAAGAKALEPVTDQFYGDRGGKLEDPFGHKWFVSTRVERISAEEMQRRFEKMFEGAPAAPMVKYMPDGYRTVTPYLIVSGLPKVIDFVTKVFGAREKFRSMKPDGTVGHAEYWIGDSVVMVAESSDDWKPIPGSIHLYVPDVDEAYRRALAAGGKALGKPEDKPYGDRNVGIVDPGGNTWWVSTHVEDVPLEG
jgi:PhnB protein